MDNERLILFQPKGLRDYGWSLEWRARACGAKNHAEEVLIGSVILRRLLCAVHGRFGVRKRSKSRYSGIPNRETCDVILFKERGNHEQPRL
jgi:hypothetical protein